MKIKRHNFYVTAYDHRGHSLPLTANVPEHFPLQLTRRDNVADWRFVSDITYAMVWLSNAL